MKDNFTRNISLDWCRIHWNKKNCQPLWDLSVDLQTGNKSIWCFLTGYCDIRTVFRKKYPEPPTGSLESMIHLWKRFVDWFTLSKLHSSVWREAYSNSRDGNEKFYISISCSRREWEFLSLNLVLRDENENFIFQSRASRREREFYFSISGFETRTRIEIRTILARIVSISILVLVLKPEIEKWNSRSRLEAWDWEKEILVPVSNMRLKERNSRSRLEHEI